MKIQITIHPTFWLTAILMGLLIGRADLVLSIIWVFIIFISVLFHEFGHALMACAFKQTPRIFLVAMGGVTSFEGKNCGFGKQFLITLNGPLFGFILYLIAYALLLFFPHAHPAAIKFLRYTKEANFYWTILNLLPILPLDGGQLLRIGLEAWLGIRGMRVALLLSVLFSFTGGMIAFMLFQQFILGTFFFIFSYQSFDLFRQSKLLTAADRETKLNEIFKQAEAALLGGNKELAKNLFEKVLEKTNKGILFTSASSYLALIFFEERQKEKAYELLLKIASEELSPEALLLLYDLAFDAQNFDIISKLSSSAYQIQPNPEIALKNAIAFAALSQPKLSGGWLKTALESGKFDLKTILVKEPAFQKIINHPEFTHFLAK